VLTTNTITTNKTIFIVTTNYVNTNLITETPYDGGSLYIVVNDKGSFLSAGFAGLFGEPYSRMISPSYPSNTQTLLSVTISPSSSTLHINGRLIASRTDGYFPYYAHVGTGINIGGAGSGTVSEIIMYNSALSTSNRQSVESYLTTKWNIQVQTPIFTGLELWLDGADPTGTGSRYPDGSNVLTWVDKSGNGYNGSNTGNTSHTNGQISVSDSAYFTSPYVPTLTNQTIFAVMNFPSSAITNMYIVSGTYGDLDTTKGMEFKVIAYSNYIQVGNRYGDVKLESPTITPSTQHLVSITITPGNTSLYVDGILQVSSNVTFTYYTTTTTIGAVNGSGKISEVLMYNTVLSSNDRQKVEGYLTKKWFLQAQPTIVKGLQVWLDGADPSGNGSRPTPGTAITTWADKSGNGYNATHANSPIYTPLGIQFNGSNQYYTTTYPSSRNTETIFVVFRTSATGQFAFVDTDSSGGRSFQLCNAIVGPSLAKSAIAWLVYGSTAISTGSTYVATCSYSSSGINIFVNGNASGSSATATTFDAGNTWIGAGFNNSFFMNGYISEVLIYSNALTTSERQGIETYLTQKWSVQPYDSLYKSSALTGLQLWLDGADPLATGIKPANGILPSWVDKSGNGYTTIATGSPSYWNGNISVTSSVTSSNYFTSSYLTNYATQTIFVVGKGSDKNVYTFFIRQSGGLGFDLRIWNNLIVANQVFSENTDNVRIEASAPINITYLFTVTLTPTLMSLYINGILAASNALVGTFPTTTQLIGSTVVDDGGPATINELMMYSNALSTSDRETVEAYLMKKWFLQPYQPSLYPGLQLWLDGADPAGTGTPPSNGTGITTWVDKSGNGYNGSNTGSPTYSNGQISVGASAYFVSQYSPNFLEQTLFIVANFNPSINTDLLILSHFIGATGCFELGVYVGGIYLNEKNVREITAAISTYPRNTQVLISITSTQRFTNMFINGIGQKPFSGTPRYINNNTPVLIGGGGSGTVSEVLMYNTALNTTDRQAIEQGLAVKWGISLSNIGYVAQPDVNAGNPGTSTLYYDGSNWSIN
jgi:hypothetical protein